MEQFIKESDNRISNANKEIEKIKSMIPFAEMTMEDYRDYYPEDAIDPLNRPTVWPHTPDMQPENEKGRPTTH